MGTGHVMRCLALAQAWQEEGGRAVFLTASITDGLESRLVAEGMKVRHLPVVPGSDEDAHHTADLAISEGASWVAVDGYHFKSEYQRIIRRSGLSLLFVDDYGHADRYCADRILNQNIYASEELYRNRAPGTRLMLGTPYVLLRKEFWPWRGWKRHIEDDARKILVTMGGSDPADMTSRLIDAFRGMESDGLEVLIVVGGSNPRYSELSSENLPKSIKLLRGVTNMPDLMAWADIAISSGGTTSWELSFMGLPAIMIILADNQVRVAEHLSRAGAAVDLGWHDCLTAQAIQKAVLDLLHDPAARSAMAKCGQRLVDGYGASRAAEALLRESIGLRDVREDDCKIVYRWANDPDVRTASFSTDLISWKSHISWFNGKLSDKRCIFLVATDDDQPIGQARFDIDGDDAVMSISLDPGARNKGLGSIIIQKAAMELFRRTHSSRVSAFIKPSNIRSQMAFERAGFTKAGLELVKDSEALRYMISRIRALDGAVCDERY